MTNSSLQEYTLKDLAQMAKKRGIPGWHSMRKNDLIRALMRDEKQHAKATATRRAGGTRTKAAGSKTVAAAKGKGEAGKTAARASGNGSASRRAASTAPHGNGRSNRATASRSRKESAVNGSGNGNGRRGASTRKNKANAGPSLVARQIHEAHREQEQLKDLSRGGAPHFGRNGQSPDAGQVANGNAANKDRIVLMVRDAYWLHAHWELSSRTVQRAQAAMAEHWHTAKPVLRLMQVNTKGTTTSTESFMRDIEIHGGVNNWYIDVLDPPCGFRVEIGYLGSNGRFHAMARSNCVMTPEPGCRDSLDQTWIDVAENCERIFALSGGYSSEGSTEELQEVLEERLSRPVGGHHLNRYGVGADPVLGGGGQFKLHVEAEMIVYGSTKPGSLVTMSGEPIKLREDGSFSLRMSLPDRRQVLPITSNSADGVMQQTVVLAVERNTKVMEPVLRDSHD